MPIDIYIYIYMYTYIHICVQAQACLKRLRSPSAFGVVAGRLASRNALGALHVLRMCMYIHDFSLSLYIYI